MPGLEAAAGCLRRERWRERRRLGARTRRRPAQRLGGRHGRGGHASPAQRRVVRKHPSLHSLSRSRFHVFNQLGSPGALNGRPERGSQSRATGRGLKAGRGGSPRASERRERRGDFVAAFLGGRDSQRQRKQQRASCVARDTAPAAQVSQRMRCPMTRLLHSGWPPMQHAHAPHEVFRPASRQGCNPGNAATQPATDPAATQSAPASKGQQRQRRRGRRRCRQRPRARPSGGVC
jgi:hypothetical protein